MQVTQLTGKAYCLYEGEWKQPIASAILTSYGEIKAVWVDKKYRNSGCGKVLLRQILSDIKDGSAELNEGVDEIIYHSHPNNIASNALAKSVGFKLWNRWYLPISELQTMECV